MLGGFGVGSEIADYGNLRRLLPEVRRNPTTGEQTEASQGQAMLQEPTTAEQLHTARQYRPTAACALCITSHRQGWCNTSRKAGRERRQPVEKPC